MRRPLAGVDLDTLTVAGGFWRAAAGRRRLGAAAVIGCGGRGRVKRPVVFVRYYVTRTIDIEFSINAC